MESRLESSTLAEQPAFRFFGLMLLIQVVLAVPLQLANVSFGLIFTQVLLFAAPLVLWCIAMNIRPAALLRWQPPAPALVLLGAALGASNFVFAGTLQLLARRLLPVGWAEQADVSHVFRHGSTVELGLILFAVGVAAPVCEELVFRGYLQTILRARFRDLTAVGTVALLFALLHFDPVGLVARVELGVLFGLLVLWSGSVWPAVAAHAANNLIAAGAFLAAQGSTGPESELPLLKALLAGLASLGLTLLLVGWFRSFAQGHPAGAPAAPPIEPGQPQRFAWRRLRKPALIWTALCVAALALFLALDWRGAAANYIDFSVPSARIRDRLPSKADYEALSERLYEAKQQARRGKVELERYRRLRGELAATGERDPSPLTQKQIAEAFARFDSPTTAANPSGAAPGR